ncbi:MAG TPA: hypothetical protein DCE23_09290 [Firmicutes bacterium]|nr:hypothetical protein [Bacillota bacterium]
MEKEFYAIKNKNDDVRRTSSSGGVFYSLASYIIENDGIVYGAAYDKDINVFHKRITNKEEIRDLQGSKYVQSNVGDAYKQVKEDLEAGKKVLFSGSPCQIAALKNILKDVNTDNLLLVDIVCHGTPAINYFNDYKKYMEDKYHSKIKSIDMRYKEKKEYDKRKINGYVKESKIEPHVMKVEFENNKVYTMSSGLDIYYQLFDYFIKKSCFKCPYSNLNRESDVTIGDFHELSSSLGKFNDGNGVSLAIINTEKGKEYFEYVKDNFELEKKKEEECLQPAIQNSANEPKRYKEFIEDYEKLSFSEIVKKYTNNSIKFKVKKVLYKVGLLDLIRTMKKGKR